MYTSHYKPRKCGKICVDFRQILGYSYTACRYKLTQTLVYAIHDN